MRPQSLLFIQRSALPAASAKMQKPHMVFIKHAHVIRSIKKKINVHLNIGEENDFNQVLVQFQVHVRMDKIFQFVRVVGLFGIFCGLT